MPQAYCCRAYNFSGKEYHVSRNLLWLVSLVSAAPLYAADFPPTHRSPRNKFFVTTIIATRHARPAKGRGEYCRADCAGLFEGLVWMDGEGQVQPAQAEAGRYWTAASAIFSICVAVCRVRRSASDGRGFCPRLAARGYPKTASPFAGYLAQAHINNARLLLRVKQMLHRWVSKRRMMYS